MAQTSETDQLFYTLRDLAKRYRVKEWNVSYAVRSRHIEAAIVIGQRPAFAHDQLDTIQRALAEIHWHRHVRLATG